MLSALFVGILASSALLLAESPEPFGTRRKN